MPKKPATSTAKTRKRNANSTGGEPAGPAPRATVRSPVVLLSDVSTFLHLMEIDASFPSFQVPEHFNLRAGSNRAQLLEQLQRVKQQLESELRGRYAAPDGQRDRVMAYQLKITLSHTSPSVWRRVLVRSDMTLGALHEVMQRVMGWEGYHRHDFTINRLRYAVLGEEFNLDAGYDEGEVSLAEVLGQVKAKGVYEYDFGDSWRHEILVEKVLELEDGLAYPVCVEGKRACPPEGCGGAWGYAELLEILSTPRHPERRERLEWLGGRFDPEAFDLEDANLQLRGLRGERLSP